MSSAQRENNMWVWAAGIFFVAIVAAIFLPGNIPQAASVKEAHYIEDTLGAATLDRVNELALPLYRRFVSVQEERELRQKFKATNDEVELGRTHKSFASFTVYAESRVDAILDMLWWVLRRLALIWLYAGLLGWFLLLALIHGYYEREIKKTDFTYSSPTRNHWARMTFSSCLWIALTLIVVPVAVEPWVMLVVAAVGIAATGLAVSNIQKRI